MKSCFEPILFDLDGTLIDSGHDIAQSVNQVLRDLDLPALALDEVLGFVGDGVRRLMECTLHHLGREDLDRQIKHFRRHYRDHLLDHTRPYPGVVDLLERLKGTALGVVTNKPGGMARAILAGLGLSRHFAAVIGGDEAGSIKPQPQPLLLACQQLGFPPEAGIMIGDYHNDIEAGRAAGMATCGVLWGFVGSEAVRAARPDHLCTQVSELNTLLLPGKGPGP